MQKQILALATCTLIAGAVQAQCQFNVYPVKLVDAFGNAMPVVGGNAQFLSDEVYLAFDPSTPSGDYYVHVVDTPDGVDEVLSLNNPSERVIHIDNNAGVITIGFVNSPNAVPVGIGPNGGESLLISPLRAPADGTCQFKAVMGSFWANTSPTDPYRVKQANPTTGECEIISVGGFRIGDGSPSDVSGTVFNDVNQNGVQDAGEAGLAGWQVDLVDASSSLSMVTDANGEYLFANVGAGSYTVELVLQAGYQGSTSTSQTIESAGCAPVPGNDFGVYMQAAACDCEGRTPGYWRNKHGVAKVNNLGLLPLLPALNIVDRCGNYVSFSNLSQYRCWMKRGNAVNMAYMLSVHLVAMHNNVAAGFVDGNCVTNDPVLGSRTISSLLADAIASLAANPYTPSGHPQRDYQEALKDALDAANNNLYWQTSGNCAPNHGCGGSGHGHARLGRLRQKIGRIRWFLRRGHW